MSGVEFVSGEETVDQTTSPVAEQQAQEPASAEVKPEAESKPKEPDHAQETKKALRGVQKRIDELTRARYETEERAQQQIEQARQEALYWRQQVEQSKANQQPPRLDQYADIEQYTRAAAAFEAQKAAQAQIESAQRAQWEYQQRQMQQAQAMQAQQQYQAHLQSKLAEAEKKFPDFLEVVSSPELPGMQGSPAFNAMLESDMGPEVMYYLAKNPARAHQLMALSPVAQVREIGRIEAALSQGKSVSQAPPPPESVSARSGSVTKDPQHMTPDEYYRYITRPWRGNKSPS